VCLHDGLHRLARGRLAPCGHRQLVQLVVQQQQRGEQLRCVDGAAAVQVDLLKRALDNLQEALRGDEAVEAAGHAAADGRPRRGRRRRLRGGVAA
jgi:hypothetical protein